MKGRHGVVLLVGLALASGCQPVQCEETYSPLTKLLVGLPIPTLITMALALLLMLAVRNMLRRPKRVPWGGLVIVLVTCVLPAIFRSLSWPMGAVVVWPACLVVLVILSVRDHGHDPEQQSWMRGVSKALEPSLADRIVAGLLVSLLVVVTFVGSILSAGSVFWAGRECREVDLDRRAPGPTPAESADSRSN